MTSSPDAPSAENMPSPAERLREAAKRNDIGAIRSALADGAGPDSRPGQASSTPLMFAAERGRVLAVQYLLEAGADPDAATSFGQTALHKACAKLREPVARLLLERGANPDARDCRGASPLLAALWRITCPISLVEALLEAGASPRGSGRPDHWVPSPLRLALVHELAPHMEALLRAGADPDEPDPWGETPREAARSFDLEAMLEQAVQAAKAPRRAKAAPSKKKRP